MSLLNQVRQAVLSPRGQFLLHRFRVVARPMAYLLGMRRYRGFKRLDPSRDTIVIVSHEASATGAPILALNLCQKLSDQFNVVVMLARGGALVCDFQASSFVVLQPRQGIVFAALLRREITRLALPGLPRYALVNSVVSAGFVQPLRSIGIPPVCLIHEFAAYIRPLDILNSLGTWSSAMVFSSHLTRQDVLRSCPQLNRVAMPVLPQGPCSRPDRPGRLASASRASVDADQFLASLPQDCILIIGAGEIQPRKGVDYFIAVADQVRALCLNKSVFFAWIGSGYLPQYDFSVSLWLEDQITRSGLSGQLQMLDHSSSYGALLERSDLFLMTSRLDPLPNVAIDAMLAAKPVLCFERACGVADLLLQDELLGSTLVAPYLNASAMATMTARLINDNLFRQSISTHIAQRAAEWFDMKNYIKSLAILGEKAACEQAIHRIQLDELIAYNAISPAWGFLNARTSIRTGTEQYLLAWRNSVWPRKPRPGFHPGIYQDLVLFNNGDTDPFLSYLKSGQPPGAWSPQMIGPFSPRCSSKDLKDASVALHVHAHYIDLIDEIFSGLAFNQISPDLFITTSHPDCVEKIQSLASSHGCRIKEVLVVPNKGRDIAPLSIELGSYLDRNYAFYGHVHTKKSALIGEEQSRAWRQLLVRNLLGSPDQPMLDIIISSMMNDARLGMVFPDDPNCVGWTANRLLAEKLAQRLGIDSLPQHFDFPVGTMFWTRRAALKPLFELELTWNDFPHEPIGYDGTIMHAIERLIPLISAKQGYSYALTYVPGVSR